MRIDEAGEHVFPGCVDHRRARRRIEISTDAGDGLIFTPDVGGVFVGSGDDVAVLDQKRHAVHLSKNAKCQTPPTITHKLTASRLF